MKLRLSVLIVAAVLAVTANASAETIAGKVTNGTSGKPAAGDDVVLLSLEGGMQEAGRTKTNAAGEYKLQAPGGSAPSLIRVVHQGVTYHKMAPPRVGTVDVTVYDVAGKLNGISTTVDVQRFQTSGDALEVLELVAMKNASNPPRTLLGDRPFEFQLPPEAQVESAMAASAGGQPVTASVVPTEKKGSYYINFPIRPGETRFEIAYRLPYKGEAVIQPKVIYPLEHFVVMLPKSMTFENKSGTNFQSMPGEGDAAVQVTTSVKPGEQIAFRLAGTGTLAELQGGDQQAQGGEMSNRPGGGLGAPIQSPDPLANWRWYILGGFAVVLVGGAIYVVRRPATQQAADTPPTVVAEPKPPSTPGNGSALLDALKDELFQLEIERQKGQISADDYHKAKDALDQTMRRALSRTNGGARQ